ncbi:MAG: Porphobilinogen deaminase [Candidatus Argoarchaeum ethanivorans]|uniref:Porphobilinogen deaminase n=1 Tax=Candidatus Argoarchaeum ethanivorans TaxID=2608793 RepID=A0A811T1R3_9EURY|nr:MAG: Porphobilinogen deaminase [Candidatus Argoarchaeum ethanivorans]
MIIGTRGSKLALAQAEIVQEKLQASGIKIIKTSGDKLQTAPPRCIRQLFPV